MQKKAVVRERLGIMIEWKQMTMQEAENKMEVLREIFDVVRLLKGSDLQAAGMESKLAGRENLCQCYAFWNKDKRCENCISLKALEEKKQTSKIEFLDSDMYQVFARYLEIGSEPYVMEMLKKLDENTLTDEEGYEKLTEKLTVYSEKLYRDVLTGAYNRRYFEEKVKNMSLNAGVAVIDLDDFKLFNDTYGHDGGDLVLTTVVNVIRHYIRRTDILVRLAMHLARLLADSHQFARMLVERYDRRLVNDDLAVVYDNRVGRTQVDSQLLCQRKQPHIVSSV